MFAYIYVYMYVLFYIWVETDIVDVEEFCGFITFVRNN